MISHRCRNCIWFDREHESLKDVKLISGKYVVGYCRKHKPVVYSLADLYWGGWPLVDQNDLCGEFRKQE